MYGLKTTIKQLKKIINEYKQQLRRMNIKGIENYPIIIDIKNETGKEDDWEIEE